MINKGSYRMTKWDFRCMIAQLSVDGNIVRIVQTFPHPKYEVKSADHSNILYVERKNNGWVTVV